MGSDRDLGDFEIRGKVPDDESYTEGQPWIAQLGAAPFSESGGLWTW